MPSEVTQTHEPSDDERRVVEQYGHLFRKRDPDFATFIDFRPLVPWWHRARRPKVRPIFAWYDLWVGVFIDREKRRAYIFPLPMVGLVVSW